MKILFLYDRLYPDTLGGVEHRADQLGRALGALGHTVTIAGMGTPLSNGVPGVDVVALGTHGRLYSGRGKRSTWGAARYAAAVARFDLQSYDLVETANIPYAHLFALERRCRRMKKPLLVTWHEYWGRTYWQRYLGSVAGLTYAAVERSTAPLGAAIAVSRLTAERLQQRRRDPIPVVPNGIPLSRLRAAAAEGQATKRPPLVLAGRLIREKRVDLLIEAVRALRPSHSPPLLTVIGDGPDAGRLRDLAADLGPYVEFLGRLPESGDVWRTMAAARVAVQPSEREGFGMFALEAMAAGLPVVHCSSPESAVEELVRHEQEGLRSEPDSESLAAAIGRLLDDEPLRERLAMAARRRAEDFDWERIAQRFLEAIETLFAVDQSGRFEH